MFGIGGSEIIVILIVALIFPRARQAAQAAKQISKGSASSRSSSRILTQTIENDENIGGAMRDIKSALRGEEEPPPPRPSRRRRRRSRSSTADGRRDRRGASEPSTRRSTGDAPKALERTPKPTIRLPPTSPASPIPTSSAEHGESREELAAMIRPVEGTVPKGSSEPN